MAFWFGSAQNVKRRILYLSYTGMLEPLGRSQVLSYVLSLSVDYEFILVSFEKPADFADKSAVKRLKATCAESGVQWHPRIYHHRPRFLATAFDLATLCRLTLLQSTQGGVHAVHCRSYIPAIAAWLCGKIAGVPFIFDMRAIWPDEMVTAGRLNERSIVYKTLKWIERRLLRNAASIVSLTEAGVDYLVERYPEVSREKFEVITTCVDVSRFGATERQEAAARLKDREPLVVGTMGTLLSGWFYLDAFFAFFKVLKTLRPDAQASIVTRDDPDQIFALAQEMGVELNDVGLRAATSEEMPELLARMDIGVMFFAPKPGSAPTRLGEFLAAGVPVAGNTGIGDLGRLIAAYDVGVVIEDVKDAASLERAAWELLNRYDGIVTSGACRYAAVDYFSVEKGVDKYRRIYRRLLSAGGAGGRRSSLNK